MKLEIAFRYFFFLSVPGLQGNVCKNPVSTNTYLDVKFLTHLKFIKK